MHSMYVWHTNIHTHIHTHIHTYIHTYIHTHIQTHRDRSTPLILSPSQPQLTHELQPALEAHAQRAALDTQENLGHNPPLSLLLLCHVPPRLQAPRARLHHALRSCVCVCVRVRDLLKRPVKTPIKRTIKRPTKRPTKSPIKRPI